MLTHNIQLYREFRVNLTRIAGDAHIFSLNTESELVFLDFPRADLFSVNHTVIAKKPYNELQEIFRQFFIVYFPDFIPLYVVAHKCYPNFMPTSS